MPEAIITVTDVCPICGRSQTIELDKEEAAHFGVAAGDVWNHHLCRKCSIRLDLRVRDFLTGPRVWHRFTKETVFLTDLCSLEPKVRAEAIALCKKLVNLNEI